jgi:hypothetical protein
LLGLVVAADDMVRLYSGAGYRRCRVRIRPSTRCGESVDMLLIRLWLDAADPLASSCERRNVDAEIGQQFVDVVDGERDDRRPGGVVTLVRCSIHRRRRSTWRTISSFGGRVMFPVSRPTVHTAPISALSELICEEL